MATITVTEEEERKKKILHSELLVDLYKRLSPSMPKFDIFLQLLTPYLDPATIAESKRDIFKLFDAMECKDHLRIGKYDVLIQIFQHIDVQMVELIRICQQQIGVVDKCLGVNISDIWKDFSAQITFRFNTNKRFADCALQRYAVEAFEKESICQVLPQVHASLDSPVIGSAKKSLIILRAASPLFYKAICVEGKIDDILKEVKGHIFENASKHPWLNGDLELLTGGQIIYRKENQLTETLQWSIDTSYTFRVCGPSLKQNVEIEDISDYVARNDDDLQQIIQTDPSIDNLIDFLVQNTDKQHVFIDALEAVDLTRIVKILDGRNIQKLMSMPVYKIYVSILNHYDDIIKKVDLDTLQKISSNLKEVIDGLPSRDVKFLLKKILGDVEILKDFIIALNIACFHEDYEDYEYIVKALEEGDNLQDRDLLCNHQLSENECILETFDTKDHTSSGLLPPEEKLELQNEKKIRRNYSNLLYNFSLMRVKDQLVDEGIISPLTKYMIAESVQKETRNDLILKSLLRFGRGKWKRFVELLQHGNAKLNKLATILEESNSSVHGEPECHSRNVDAIKSYMEMQHDTHEDKDLKEKFLHPFFEEEIITIDEHERVLYGLESIRNLIILYKKEASKTFQLNGRFEHFVEELEQRKTTEKTGEKHMVTKFHAVEVDKKINSIKSTLKTPSPLFLQKFKAAIENGDVKKYLLSIADTYIKQEPPFATDVEITIIYHRDDSTEIGDMSKYKDTLSTSKIKNCHGILTNEIVIEDIEQALLDCCVIERNTLLQIIKADTCNKEKMDEIITLVTERPMVIENFIEALRLSGYIGIAKILDGSCIEHLSAMPDFKVRMCLLDNYQTLIDEIKVDEFKTVSVQLKDVIENLQSQNTNENVLHLLFKKCLLDDTCYLHAFIDALSNHIEYHHILKKLEDTSFTYQDILSTPRQKKIKNSQGNLYNNNLPDDLEEEVKHEDIFYTYRGKLHIPETDETATSTVATLETCYERKEVHQRMKPLKEDPSHLKMQKLKPVEEMKTTHVKMEYALSPEQEIYQYVKEKHSTEPGLSGQRKRKTLDAEEDPSHFIKKQKLKPVEEMKTMDVKMEYEDTSHLKTQKLDLFEEMKTTHVKMEYEDPSHLIKKQKLDPVQEMETIDVKMEYEDPSHLKIQKLDPVEEMETTHIKMEYDKERIKMNLDPEEISLDKLKAWREDDETFCATKSTELIYKTVKHKGLGYLICGLPGAGKTANVHHIALRLKGDGYTLCCVDGIKELIDKTGKFETEQKQVYVIDDVFGAHGVNDETVKEWTEKHKDDIKRCLDKPNIILLCSSRVQVVNDQKLSNIIKSYFTVINISEVEGELSSEERSKERLGIFRKHASVKGRVDLLKDEIENKIKKIECPAGCFPLICRLYAGDKETNQTIENYFNKPLEQIQEHIQSLQNSPSEDVRLGYFCLLTCMLYDNKVPVNTMEVGKEEQETKNKRQELLELCELSESTSRPTIKKKMDTLLQTFVKREGSHYHFVHDLIHDAVIKHVSGSSSSVHKVIMRHCSSKFMRYRVHLSGVVCKDRYHRGHDTESCINIRPDSFTCWGIRVLDIVRDGVRTSDQLYNDIAEGRCSRYDDRRVVWDNPWCDVFKYNRCVHSTEGQTAIVQALKSSDVQTIMCTKGYRMEYRGPRRVTGLHCAMEEGLTHIVTQTLSMLSPTQIREVVSIHDGGLLYRAIGGRCGTDVIQALIVGGVDVNTPDVDGDTPLCSAIRERCGTDVIQALIDSGADVNTPVYGLTPLCMSVLVGDYKITQLFVDNGADVNQCDEDGTSVLYESQLRGRDTITELLLSRGAVCMYKGKQYNHIADTPDLTLFDFVRYNNYQAVKILIERGDDINQCYKDGTSVLYQSQLRGRDTITELLQSRGAVCMYKDKQYTTITDIPDSEVDSGYEREMIQKIKEKRNMTK